MGQFLPTLSSVQFSSVAQSCPTLQPDEPQHTRPPCPSPTPGIHPNPCPSSQWCHPTISSSVVPFSSCLQSFPASGSFQMSQLSTSGGQSIEVSASTQVLPVNIQDWFPLGWTGWIALQSKGLSNTIPLKWGQGSLLKVHVSPKILTVYHTIYSFTILGGEPTRRKRWKMCNGERKWSYIIPF